MANGTVVGDLSNTVQAEITPGIRESMGPTDGIFERIRNSSMGVKRDGIGRDFYVYHNFIASLAGAYYWRANPLGSTTLTSVLPGHVLNSVNAFPGAGEAANMGTVQRRLQLVQGTGNFFLPVQLFQVDQLDAATIKYVGLNIQQVAKLVAHMRAVSFWHVAPAGTLQPLGQIETVTDGGGTSDDTVTVTVDGSTYGIGRIRNFYPGMFVDILDAGSGYASLKDSRDYAVVTEVDPFNKTVKIALTTSTYDWEAQIVAGDVIVAKDCAAATDGYGPSGVEDWVKAVDTGTDVQVFNIYISTDGSDLLYPQFGSLVAAVSAPLTEAVLNKYVGGFMDATGKKLDTLATTGGVVREMLEQVDDLGVFQRQGAALDLVNGWSKIGYQYGGQSLQWLISSFISPGRLYGLKTGEGNLTRYVPPKIPGTGSHASFDGDVQFIAKMSGSTNIFKPLHNSSGNTTEVMEAPFITLEEIAPMDVQSVKLTGITESNP